MHAGNYHFFPFYALFFFEISVVKLYICELSFTETGADLG